MLKREPEIQRRKKLNIKRCVHLTGMFIQEISFKHKKKVFYCGSDPILEHIARDVVESLTSWIGHINRCSLLSCEQRVGADDLQRC